MSVFIGTMEEIRAEDPEREPLGEVLRAWAKDYGVGAGNWGLTVRARRAPRRTPAAPSPACSSSQRHQAHWRNYETRCALPRLALPRGQVGRNRLQAGAHGRTNRGSPCRWPPTPADAIAKSVAGAAPVTTKINPGNAWNPAVMFGADQLS